MGRSDFFMICRQAPMTLFAGPSASIRGASFSTIVYSHRRFFSRRWAAEIHDGDPALTTRLTPYVCFVYRRGLTRAQINAAHDDLVELLSDFADEGINLSDAVDAVGDILIRYGKIEPTIYEYDLKRKYVEINLPQNPRPE